MTPFQPIPLHAFYRQVCGYLALYTDKDVPFLPDDLEGEFSYEPREDTDVSGSSEMAYLLHVIGELEIRTDVAGRRRWSERIRGYLDPATGLVTRDFPGSKANRLHATGFAVGALRLLGADPYPQTAAARVLASPQAVTSWIDSFLWVFIWWGAHDMGLAAAHFMYPEGTRAPPECHQWVLDDLSRRINPRTGLWQRHLQWLRGPDTVALGGSAHFWWQYWAAGKSMPYPRQALDSILDLQMPSGLWGNIIFNGDYPQYIDVDAICGLRFAWKTLAAVGEGDLLDRQYRSPIIAALRAWARVAISRLTEPHGLYRYYGTGAHKLPGGMAALSEADILHRELTGGALFEVPDGRRLRSLFEVAPGDDHVTVAWV